MNFSLIHPPMEAWNWLYDLSFALNAMMLFGVMVATLPGRPSANFHSPWVLWPAGLGLMYMLMFPWNMIIFMSIQVMMSNLGAPTGAVIISILFTIGSWLLTVNTLFTARKHSYAN